jgi:hypothetical protein
VTVPDPGWSSVTHTVKSIPDAEVNRSRSTLNPTRAATLCERTLKSAMVTRIIRGL